MNRRLIGAATAALFFLGMIALTQAPAGAEDSELSTKVIMQKLHKGPKSSQGALKAALKASPTDWKTIQDKTKDYVILGAGLAKNDPAKGEKASWKTLSDSFFTNAKALDDSAKKKDLASTQAAFGKLNGSCMACHRAHKK
jgi:cytochrome c556